MTDISKKIIYQAADYYMEALVSKLIFKLKRVPQEYRLNPNCGLNNLWEEICVQKQTERWYGYNLVEDYLEAQISILLDSQPEHVKNILSYDEYDTELVFDESSVLENILLQLYRVAENYRNKSIDRFLN